MDKVGKAVITSFDNPITKALLRLPGIAQLGGASIDAIISGMIDFRRTVFFKEIERRQLHLTDKLIKEEKFIDFFLITLEAVDRTRMKEKIEMFSAILCSYVKTEMPEDGIHESLRDIIARLNVNDILILQQIITFEQESKQRSIEQGGKPIIYTGLVRRDWDDFSKMLPEKLNVPVEAISLSLHNLVQNGLIKKTLSYNNSSIKIWEPGKTLATPLYYTLLGILE